MEGDRGRDAVDVELVQGPEHATARRFAILAPRDQLGEQRVVVAHDPAALGETRVEADERSPRRLESGDQAGPGKEVPRRVLRVDPALDRVATGRGRRIDPLAHRHHELQLHQIQAGDHLADRVLDLEARVHLDEIEARLVHQELHGPGVGVPGRLGDGRGRFPDPGPQRFVDDRRGTLLDQLLIPALEGAVTFAQERHVTAGVGQDLGFPVMGAGDVPLEVDLRPAEVGGRLARRALHRLGQRLGLVDQVHALAAAPERRLDHQREPDPPGLGSSLRR